MKTSHSLVIAFVHFIFMVWSPTPVCSNQDSRYRLFKHGDVILGGLARLHRKSPGNACGIFYSPGLGRVEAMMYAVDQINKNLTILHNITLGYDIRDFCQDPVMAARYGYEFAIASKMNCKYVKCTLDHHCACVTNGSSENQNLPDKNYSTTYPVAAIVGALTSRAAIPLANFLQAVRIPLIDSTATSEELSSPMYDSFFRTIPSDANQAKAIADIIDHFAWRYIAVVAVDDSYGRHGAAALERESIQRQTFCFELAGYIPLSNYSEKLKIIVSNLKQRQTVRVIVLWSHSFQGRDLLKEAARNELQDRVWIFSEALAMVKPEFLPLNKGLSSTSTGVHFGVQLPQIKSDGFLSYLRNKLSKNNTKIEQHFWWKEFWEVASSKFNCSTETDRDCDQKMTVDALVEMVHDDFVPYIIDAIHTAAHALDKKYKCHHPNGSVTPRCREHGSHNDVITHLKEVEFDGITGKVEFDSRGDPVEALYDIVYFNITKENGVDKLSKNIIGQWNKVSENRMRLRLTDALIPWDSQNGQAIPASTCTEECKPGEWKLQVTRCCWRCLRCADGSISSTYEAQNCTECTSTQMSNLERTKCEHLPVSNVDWTDASAIIVILICFVGIVIDISAAIIFSRFRHTPIVKASNKVYSFVLLLGIGLCFVMAFMYVVKPSTKLCLVLKPLRYLVYTLCCSALFLKTMQIVHAFNVSRLKDWIWVFICSTKRQVLVLSLIIAMESLLGVGWILLDPPYIHKTIIPKSHVFVTCLSYKSIPGQVFEHLMLIYLLSMAGLCTYYAYQARNLPANFNEAKYISFSLYIFLLSWITYYPIDFALEGWYVAVLSAATILLSSYGLLGCIFAPKLYIILRHPEKNTPEFVRAELRQSTVNRSVNNASSFGSGGSPV